MFSLQDNSGGKIRQALFLSDSSKKQSQNRSNAALQDNDSVKFKFVYALQDRVLQDRDRLSHIPRKLDQTLPIPRQSHILSTVLKDEERVKVHIHSKT